MKDEKFFLKEYENKAEFVDVRMENGSNESVLFHNSSLKSFSKSESFSYGVRMLVDGAWGFASSARMEEMEEVFKRAFLLAKSASKRIREPLSLKEVSHNKDKVKLSIKKDPFIVDDKDKISLAKDISSMFSYKGLKSKDVHLTFVRKKKTYLNSSGAEVEENHIYSRLFGIIVAGRNLANTTFSLSGKKGYELFDRDFSALVAGAEMELKELVNARAIRPGRYDIVSDPKMTGTFFHEAIGHALEADGLRQKSTCVSLGEDVAVPSLTLIDDPTLPYKWGSYAYDDEGFKAKPSVLIKKGIIVNFMNDVYNFSQLEGLSKTANGRAESPICLPLPRMSNIVVKQGTKNLDELFEEIRNGIYVKGFVGGAVDTMTGVFGFKSNIAYEIKNGRQGRAIKGLSLSGNLKELLKRIISFSNYVEYDSSGFCGKEGQHVPVSEKVPHMSVGGVNVGH